MLLYHLKYVSFFLSETEKAAARARKVIKKIQRIQILGLFISLTFDIIVIFFLNFVNCGFVNK